VGRINCKIERQLNEPVTPAPLRIILTSEEDRTLTELRVAQNLPQRTRDRAHMLRLNAQGWNNVPAIAEMFETILIRSERRWRSGSAN